MLSLSEGRDFFRLIGELAPELLPQRYGNFEPLRHEFNAEQIEEVLKFWQWPFLWKRKNPAFEGGVWQRIGPRSEHSWVTLSGSLAGVHIDNLVSFLWAASLRFNGDFGFVHLLTPEEAVRGVAMGTVTFLGIGSKNPHLSVSPKLLCRYIPDLFWGTVLGPAYLEHLGREKILSVPAPVVRELDEHHVYIQLSQDLVDLKVRYGDVEKVRQAVKLHLGQDSFFDPEKDAGHSYSVPHFNIPSENPES